MLHFFNNSCGLFALSGLVFSEGFVISAARAVHTDTVVDKVKFAELSCSESVTAPSAPVSAGFMFM